MIESFIHKGLKELFVEGKSIRIQKSLINRTIRRLDAIDAAKSLDDLKIPGFNFHGLEGVPNVTASISMAHGASPLSGAMKMLIDLT